VAVSAFLVDLFATSDPREAQGKPLTAQALLDRGAARIETDLADQPAVQAAMMDVMGRVYRNQGRYEEADTLLRRALAQRRRTLGPEHHPDVAESLTSPGILLQEQGRFDDAEPLFREGLALRRATLDSPHDELVAALNNLGALFHYQGRLDSAEVYYRAALGMGDRLPDTAPTEKAVNLGNLAMALKGQGQYAATAIRGWPRR